PTEVDVRGVHARRSRIRRDKPEDRFGAREGAADDVGVAMRTLDDFDAAAQLRREARRLTQDDAGWLVARNDALEDLAPDLTSRSCDNDHVTLLSSRIRERSG